MTSHRSPHDIPVEKLPKELERVYEEYEEALDKDSRGWHCTAEIKRLEKWINDARQLLEPVSV